VGLFELRGQFGQFHIRRRPLRLDLGELGLQRVQPIAEGIGTGPFAIPALLRAVCPGLHLAGSQLGRLCPLLRPIGAATFRSEVGRKGFDDGRIGLRSLTCDRYGRFQGADKADDFWI
jgi:hypothetical protein